MSRGQAGYGGLREGKRRRMSGVLLAPSVPAVNMIISEAEVRDKGMGGEGRGGKGKASKEGLILLFSPFQWFDVMIYSVGLLLFFFICEIKIKSSWVFMIYIFVVLYLETFILLFYFYLCV